MRKVYLLSAGICMVPCFAAAQQLTFTPQVGFQSSNTKVSFNNSPFYTPDRNGTAFAGFRLSYQSKKGHGPYLGFGLGTSTNTYILSDPNFIRFSSAGMTDIFRLEGGYQWSSKPIYFKRIWDNGISREEFASLKKKGWHVRLQPYIGMAMQFRNGSTATDKFTTPDGSITNYYGRRGLAITTGLNLEFGKNGKRKFTLSINYVHGLRTMQSTYIQRNYNGIDYSTQLYNRSSGFTITLGIPLTLWSKKNK